MFRVAPGFETKGDEDVIEEILKHIRLWPVESLSLDLEALDRKVERVVIY